MIEFGVGENNHQMTHKLDQVLLKIEQCVAPRKDKYALQTNTLVHLASEHKSRFIDYHRELLVSRY